MLDSNILFNTRQGFSLIELSIVLVLIGMIIGGVLVGKDMIEAANIRKTTTEIETLKSSVNTFRLKYNCLPGDCTNANALFSGGVNGNGNGFVESGTSNSVCTEGFQAWIQLRNAGLTDLPVVTLAGGNLTVGVLGQTYAFYEFPVLLFGKMNVNSFELAYPLSKSHPTYIGCRGINSVFSIAVSRSIDQIIDDGIANKGRLISLDGNEATANSCCFIYFSGRVRL